MKPIVLMVDKYLMPFCNPETEEITNTNTMNVPRVDKLSQPTDRSMNVAKPPSIASKTVPREAAIPATRQNKHSVSINVAVDSFLKNEPKGKKRDATVLDRL